MSASKQKKDRVELRNSGNDKKANAAAEKAQKDRKYKIKAIVAAVIVVIVIAAAALINSNVFYTKTTAVKIGNTSYSAAEVSTFYNMALNNIYSDYYQTYGDYTSYILNPNSPLDEQQYDENQTWADYIYDATITNMTQVTVLYDQAMANGYQLTAENQENIDANIASVQSYATSYGYQNLNQFLAASYGKGMNEQLYRDLLTRLEIADAYSRQVSDSFTYSEQELKDYYAENADTLDFITYYYYMVSTGSTAFEELEDDAKAAAAHDAAVEIADATDLEELNANIQDFTGDASEALMMSYQSPNIGEDYREWLLDGARKNGETTVVDTESGSYVVMFSDRNKNDYKLVDMRHILINAVADEEGNVTEEALATAKATAEDLLAQWQADPTEENFAALANEYSEDEGSNTKGGLYERVYKNFMVDEINSFLFEEGTKVGDAKVVYGNNGSYEGYHVVYLAGEGELFCDYLADSLLRQEAYNAYLTDASASYGVSTGLGLKFADLK